MASVRCVFAFRHQQEDGFRCAWHRHPCCELVLIESGGCDFEQDGRTRRVGVGSILASKPGQVHRATNRGISGHLCVGISGCGAEALAPGVHPGTPALARRFGEVFAAARGGGDRLDLLAGLLALELGAQEQPGTAEADPTTQARELIDAEYDRIVSVAELAARVGRRPDRLRAEFGERYGESPQQALIRRRIQVACERLHLDPQPIAAIAASCGFRDPYYFTRVFTRLQGCSPSAWRKRHGSPLLV
jgi:AraC-like DNA-binding protein